MLTLSVFLAILVIGTFFMWRFVRQDIEIRISIIPREGPAPRTTDFSAKAEADRKARYEFQSKLAVHATPPVEFTSPDINHLEMLADAARASVAGGAPLASPVITGGIPTVDLAVPEQASALNAALDAYDQRDPGDEADARAPEEETFEEILLSIPEGAQQPPVTLIPEMEPEPARMHRSPRRNVPRSIE